MQPQRFCTDLSRSLSYSYTLKAMGRPVRLSVSVLPKKTLPKKTFMAATDAATEILFMYAATEILFLFAFVCVREACEAICFCFAKENIAKENIHGSHRCSHRDSVYVSVLLLFVYLFLFCQRKHCQRKHSWQPRFCFCLLCLCSRFFTPQRSSFASVS
jgi:hypothetical protein